VGQLKGKSSREQLKKIILEGDGFGNGLTVLNGGLKQMPRIITEWGVCRHEADQPGKLASVSLWSLYLGSGRNPDPDYENPFVLAES
tara:strand:- start:118305 stop:118565 length:261 start_codon:yes stop_codon:yes gene_type:complete